MGFLKFLLAVALCIGGFLLMGGAFVGGVQTGMSNDLFGGHNSQVIPWIMGIGGFVMLLGGIYMLRRKV